MVRARALLSGPHWGQWLLALALCLAGSVLLARFELARLREAFDTDARIAHRLLSQRVVQHDAVLSTLALLQPQADAAVDAGIGRRLSSVYPQIIDMRRRGPGQRWPDDALALAETASAEAGRAALAHADLPGGRYQLVQAAVPASYALLIDLRATVPASEWPIPPETGPVRIELVHEGRAFVVQPGRPFAGQWHFDFHKHLASASQPFDVHLQRDVSWRELPWLAMLAWSLCVVIALLAIDALRRQRERHRRAEEWLRLGQVARLNTLGELAAGMAHELNQPLTAVLANTQAARRLLDDEPPELATARGAIAQAATQARRAAEVVSRLRRVVEQPDPAAHARPVVLQEAVRGALYLLAPEFERERIAVRHHDGGAAVTVQAEPVALEQIIHNLLVNALQALAQVAADERRLDIRIDQDGSHGRLHIADSGPGIAPEVLPRLFEPFFTTRASGLGLGLNLCESLAGGMGGRLEAAHHAPRGAVFTLLLPLARESAA